MSISKLPALLVSQIAAGEVIERPASVVKELIENSLDAGASKIDLSVDNGGHDRIRVSDDGNGIPSNQLVLAVTPHATSKLQTVEQLAKINTLGFRGEALASAASVSRLRLISRPRGKDAAALEVTGEHVNLPQPTASAPGTVVEVLDLFFNVPARRKFLRTAATEFGHIHDVVNRIAMIHPRVSFRLAHNGRMILDLAAADDPRRRHVELLGKDLEEALLDLDDPATPDGMKISGVIGLPAIARASSRHLYLSVNGRPVRNRQLVHAIRQAYRGLLPSDRYPMATITIQLDPQQVDVNVHPTKAEVRFGNPSGVHGALISVVRDRLLNADLTPSASLAPLGERWREPRHDRINAHTTGPGLPREPLNRMDPTQKDLVYEQVRQAMAEGDPGPESPTPQPVNSGHTPCSILQIHNSYLVAEDEQGIIIIDQHALHERVMFESLCRRVLAGKNLESQRLLMPEVLDVTPHQQTVLETIQPLLQRIGIEVGPFGEHQIAIQACASFLFSRGVDAAPFLRQLLDRVEDGAINVADRGAEEAALHEVLDMMACKAAVKAGDKMNPEELDDLLAQGAQIERRGSCPHGRPTTIRISLQDLEKQFGRT